jgi:hypothetical protein
VNSTYGSSTYKVDEFTLGVLKRLISAPLVGIGIKSSKWSTIHTVLVNIWKKLNSSCMKIEESISNR